MNQLRDKLIEISDLVSRRLTAGGSSLDRHDANMLCDLLGEASPLAHDYAEWLNKGGFQPRPK
jgi:hypothetical protein